MEISKFVLKNGNTIKPIKEIEICRNEGVFGNYDLLPSTIIDRDIQSSCSFECESKASKDLLSACNNENIKCGDYLYIVTGNQIQARKHKKKRINKKWLKRYGYKYKKDKVKARIKEVTSITPSISTNEEMIGNMDIVLDTISYIKEK